LLNLFQDGIHVVKINTA